MTQCTESNLFSTSEISDSHPEMFCLRWEELLVDKNNSRISELMLRLFCFLLNDYVSEGIQNMKSNFESRYCLSLGLFKVKHVVFPSTIKYGNIMALSFISKLGLLKGLVGYSTPG